MGTNNRLKTGFKLHNQATQAGNGEEILISRQMLTANIDIDGTASSFTIVFEGKSSDNTDYRAIMAVNLSTFDMASTTSTLNTLWQVGLDGLVAFRCRLSTVSGGNVSVVVTITD
jgi:hypothetical protein